jgi:uncharacterized protein YkwD
MRLPVLTPRGCTTPTPSRTTAARENVARARSLPLAYRALHASPSHRMNLLRADYTHVGLSVVNDDDGTVYVCQVFAGGMR